VSEGPPTRDLGTHAVVTTIHSDGARKEKLRQRAWKPPASRTSPRPYAELHAASAFSFLDGASLPEDLADRAAALGLPAVALLDTNGVYGAPRFHKAAKQAGIKAIVGAEVVIDNDSCRPARSFSSLRGAKATKQSPEPPASNGDRFASTAALRAMADKPLLGMTGLNDASSVIPSKARNPGRGSKAPLRLRSLGRFAPSLFEPGRTSRSSG
jgi:hypothetical protein